MLLAYGAHLRRGGSKYLPSPVSSSAYLGGNFLPWRYLRAARYSQDNNTKSTLEAAFTNRRCTRIPPIAKITFTGILPWGVTGKDVIVALCGLFNQDEVLNHALEFTGSEETLASIPIHDRLTIANMTTEWGSLSGKTQNSKMKSSSKS